MRTVTLDKPGLRPTGHFVNVGFCTGSVIVETARRVERITAAERKPDRLGVTRKDLAASDYDADVTLCKAEAPDGLPTDASAMFIGGSRDFEAVLDHAVETGVDQIAMSISRVEPAGDAIETFRERGLLSAVVQL